MVSLQSILAATDFSTDARRAAERAAMICATAGLSRGAVLHVLESSWLDTLKRFSLRADLDQSMANASRALDEWVATLRERSGITLEPQVRVGKVLNTILEAATDFDLLALGARGNHPLRDFAVGTTAERLLRQTHKPILVVRREAAAPYQRVLVAVDFSPHSRRALAWGTALAPQGEIYLAHVFEALFAVEMRYASVTEETVQEYRAKARAQAEADLQRFIDAFGVDEGRLHRSIEQGGHVPTKLLDKAREIGADLVVVGKHGQSLTEALLLGSVTLHLLAACPCDVLVTQ